jgi:hypothetical protein
MSSLLKSVDVYGEKISLTYKGEDSFKTGPGAFASFLIIAVILSYATYRSYIFLNRLNPDVSKKGFMKDLNVAEEYRP